MTGGKAAKFQVQLFGTWTDYQNSEDKILKRAYLAGFPNAKYTFCGQQYEIDFKSMKQENAKSGKAHTIRPPYKWKPPAAPIVQPGPTTCIKVPSGAPGTIIQVPHPKDRSQFMSVSVPAAAKVGQAMLVPVPPLAAAPPPAQSLKAATPSVPPAEVAPTAVASAATPSAPPAEEAPAAVAPAFAGAAAIGGVVVGGVLLGEHIAEEGWDATMQDLGDWFEGAGETIADGADAAVDWVGDAADTAGDFIMDLF